ncbi:S-adenosyl-L-methionine-dependent methyltransferases superfamily protein [Prunus dulcis]|uniref:S-adenosyl-L-methionine-dependent methyltransferases superfamily protein n=1 Tax=Prunus dulcis TaxID=3755 RepID=A0A4Y1RBX6_PRUDU|nr:S-adenosyl-L-methionine-dependent methyltransferases superfamily protein [Prunus dulcis]
MVEVRSSILSEPSFLFLAQDKYISLFVRIILVQILVRNFLYHKNRLAHFPEQLVCFWRPQLVPEQNDAVVLHQRLHGGHERAHSLLYVNDVRRHDDVVRRAQGLGLIRRLVPVHDGVLERLPQDGLVALEVVLQCGHDRGNIGEDDVGQAEQIETHAGGSAAGAELYGSLAVEVEEVGVGVLGNGAGWGPALGEFDKDQGTGPDGGADVEGAVVLLEGKDGGSNRELYHWKIKQH